MLQSWLLEQTVPTICAALAGMFAGRYAWRIAVRYAHGLHGGVEPDARLMLRAATEAVGRQHAGHVAAAGKSSATGVVMDNVRHGWLAGCGLALACGWLCLQAVPPTQAIALMLLLFMLLTLACIDALCGLLPDALTWPLLLLGLAFAGMGLGQIRLPEAIFAAGFAYVLLLGLSWLFRRLRRRDGLGGGDVKCIAAIAAWCGLQGLFLVMLVASLLGVLYALVLCRSNGWSQAYPFGPCLALAVVAWLPYTLGG